MKPIEFPEQNVIFAKDQPEYNPLPAFRANTQNGEVISCWQLSLEEIEVIRETGRVYVNLLSFGGALTPSHLTVNKEDYQHLFNNGAATGE